MTQNVINNMYECDFEHKFYNFLLKIYISFHVTCLKYMEKYFSNLYLYNSQVMFFLNEILMNRIIKMNKN